MKYFKMKLENGTSTIVKGKTTLEVVKKHNLATREHINTRLIELEGEQLAIAISNEQ